MANIETAETLDVDAIKYLAIATAFYFNCHWSADTQLLEVDEDFDEEDPDHPPNVLVWEDEVEFANQHLQAIGIQEKVSTFDLVATLFPHEEEYLNRLSECDDMELIRVVRVEAA